MKCKHKNRKLQTCGKLQGAWVHLLAELLGKGGHRFEAALGE